MPLQKGEIVFIPLIMLWLRRTLVLLLTHGSNRLQPILSAVVQPLNLIL